jgi:hypothetical protein
LDSAFYLAKDGVHPGEIGHWLMAKEILISIGESEVKNYVDIHDAIASHAMGEEILSLVSKRQALLRDAWLTATGHLRPGINAGIPLEEAQAKGREIDAEIKKMLK